MVFGYRYKTRSLVTILKNDFLEEAIKIVSDARKKNIVLRIMGAVAIRIKCAEYLFLYDKLQRELTDIDFIGYSKQGSKISTLLRDLGYEVRKDMLVHEGRYFFFNPKTGLKVDVFLDKLSMNHTISFKNRLELDFPTIPLSDLALEKLQIVKINEKDLKDLIVLFRAHEVGDDPEINADYVAKLLASDWGFYYTVIANLNKLKVFLEESKIPDEHKRNIKEKIDKLYKRIEAEPKSLKWRLRAKMGSRVKWYNDVEEVER